VFCQNAAAAAAAEIERQHVATDKQLTVDTLPVAKTGHHSATTGRRRLSVFILPAAAAAAAAAATADQHRARDRSANIRGSSHRTTIGIGRRLAAVCHHNDPSSLQRLRILQDTCRIAGWPLRNSVTASRYNRHQSKNRPIFFARSRSSLILKPLTIFAITESLSSIPLGHHSMREEILSNIFVAPTFNQLQ